MKNLKEKPTREKGFTKAFRRFLEFYDWYTKLGGEIPQEKYHILIKKFDYENNL